MECFIEGCRRPVDAAQRCHSHYEHRRRTGTDRLSPYPETFEERFWEKVASPRIDGSCWLWNAATDGSGRYGAIYRDGHLHRAHRVAYELTVGAIPDGKVIDHLCRVTLCVNPAHMEVVDQYTNIMRGRGFGALNAAKTHCKWGHEFTPENTKVRDGGGRFCIACADAYNTRRVAEYRRRGKISVDSAAAAGVNLST